MPLALYGHPFSSYTQKALIAQYENEIPFEFRGRPTVTEISSREGSNAERSMP